MLPDLANHDLDSVEQSVELPVKVSKDLGMSYKCLSELHADAVHDCQLPIDSQHFPDAHLVAVVGLAERPRARCQCTYLQHRQPESGDQEPTAQFGRQALS